MFQSCDGPTIDFYNPNGAGSMAQENTNTPIDWLVPEIKTGLNFSFGIVISLLMLLTIPCMIKKWKKKDDKDSKNDLDNNVYSTYTTFWVIALISLYMTTRAFPWVIMPQVLTTVKALHKYLI